MTLAAAAARLAGLLGDSAPLWRPAPFHDDPPWVTQLPALAGSLLSVPDARLDALERDPAALAALLAPALPVATDLLQAAGACLDGDTPPPLPFPETAGRDVPGRKWQQTLHLAAACTPGNAAQLVDWCCGKAHLGRLLARHHGLPVTGIERDARLCADGERLAARDQLPVRIRQADACLVSADDAQLHADTLAVALHACGDLHLALLRAGSRAGISGFVVAPCCYHLTRDTQWRPLSAALAAHPLAGLALGRDELRLAVQDTVTASARVTRQARQLAAWRLGFDALQRQVRGQDSYLPTPSRPARVLADGFAAFCADLAAHHGFTLPPGTDHDAWAAHGEHRLARVRRLELLRHAFRRPLEVLLVADRALFLAEQGYRVRLARFCPVALTPRNLVILATRDAA